MNLFILFLILYLDENDLSDSITGDVHGNHENQNNITVHTGNHGNKTTADINITDVFGNQPILNPIVKNLLI